MPSTSQVQRQAMAIAEHHPEQLYARNKAMLKMSKSQLHDYASTKQKGLPKRAKASAKPAKPLKGATAPLSQAMRAQRR